MAFADCHDLGDRGIVPIPNGFALVRMDLAAFRRMVRVVACELMRQ